jgi:hypothetical protein
MAYGVGRVLSRLVYHVPVPCIEETKVCTRTTNPSTENVLRDDRKLFPYALKTAYMGSGVLESRA